MSSDKLCIAAMAERGDHLCRLLLRHDGRIPGGLWSWSVYVDGDVHHRGPGSTRKDALHWYAMLPAGRHRVVVRAPDPSAPDRPESNTLHFTIEDQEELVIDVAFRNGAIVLASTE